MPILRAKGLTKKFGNLTALSNLDLEIPRGRIIGLLGPNGSGKSTFIKLATGLLVPTSGEITIGGAAPGIETKAMVSYLPERTYLNDWMRAEDMIAFFGAFYGSING